MVDVHSIWMINKGKERSKKKKDRSMRANELKRKRHQNSWSQFHEESE